MAHLLPRVAVASATALALLAPVGMTSAHADPPVTSGNAHVPVTPEDVVAAASIGPRATPITAYSIAVATSVARSGILTRAVLPGGAKCPDLRVTRVTKAGTSEVRTIRMTRRSTGPTTVPAFRAVAVCEARMPVGARTASVAGITVPAAMPTRVRSMAIMGDTGCRIRGSQVQDCSDPYAWPLPRIAQAIHAERPDVILYTGDVFYREDACPPGSEPQCANSPAPIPGKPFRDSAYGWLADAILPMAPMLRTAPIVMMRGNHEECYRGGNGWYLFFEPTWGTGSACAPASDGTVPTVITPTYAIDLPISATRELRLSVVDSANGADDTVTPSLQPLQRVTYEDAAALAEGADEAWLLTHRPILGIVTTDFTPPPPSPWVPWTSVDQAAASVGTLAPFDLILSSHIHLAQAVQVPGQPGQLVLGNGGTLLDPPTGYAIPPGGQLQNAFGQPMVPGVEPYPPASSLWTDVRFGYAMAVPGRATGAWTITMHDPDGEQFARCSLANGAITCRTTS